MALFELLKNTLAKLPFWQHSEGDLEEARKAKTLVLDEDSERVIRTAQSTLHHRTIPEAPAPFHFTIIKLNGLPYSKHT